MRGPGGRHQRLAIGGRPLAGPVHLSRTTGTSVGQALEVIDTGKALPDLPHTDRAFRSGALSPAQAKEIARAGRADPSAEGRLVEKAQHQSLSELKEECRKVTAAATDEDQRDEKIHAERYLRHYTDSEGAGRIDAKMRTRDLALLLSYLQPFQDRVFARARADGRRDPSEAYALDAMLAMAETAADGDGDDAANDEAPPARPLRRWNPKPSIRLRADMSAVLRGHTISGETCEIPGVGPVPVSFVRALLPESIIHIVLTHGVDVLNVTDHSRHVADAVRGGGRGARRRPMRGARVPCPRSPVGPLAALRQDAPYAAR